MRLVCLLLSAVLGLSHYSAKAQTCDPTVPPDGLSATYTPGVGALLQWNAVPGSVGVQVKATLPAGAVVQRRIVGSEIDQFLISDALLANGSYTWQVQAACSSIPPFSATPVSSTETFVKPFPNCGTVTDIDGNTYNTVLIAGLCWTKENLKVQRFRNGDLIPFGLTDAAWQSTIGPAAAVHSGNLLNKDIYGLLYNWQAVIDSRGLCPLGWHVGSDAEWTILTDFLGGLPVSGGLLKTTGNLTAGTGLWRSPNIGATDSYGFSVLPSAMRRGAGGIYFNLGESAYFYAPETPTTGSRSRSLGYNGADMSRGFVFDTKNGYAIRCVLD